MTMSRMATRVLRPLTLLTVSGVGAIAYGVYTLRHPWPTELRRDLRAGITALHQGDLLLSERYLRRAWNSCQTISLPRLGNDPWLKLSGVASRLGELLETAHHPEQSYAVYSECLAMMQAHQQDLTPAERQRAIAIAIHLAQLADTLRNPHDQEKWLQWSVDQSRDLSQAIKHHHIYSETLEAALEALASFHAKSGNTERAIATYTQILPLIANPNDPRPSPHRRCRAGQVITTLSNLLTDNPSPEHLYIAHQLTNDALKLVDHARRTLPTPDADCERVWAALLFNLGAILEMQEERDGARMHFTRALAHARSIDMPEGVREAEDALARLEGARVPDDVD